MHHPLGWMTEVARTYSLLSERREVQAKPNCAAPRIARQRSRNKSKRRKMSVGASIGATNTRYDFLQRIHKETKKVSIFSRHPIKKTIFPKVKS